MWTNAIRTIKARLSSGGSGKTFLYKFSVDSPTQNHYRNRYLGLGSKGVVHADELAYLWKNEYSDVPLKDSIEFQSIKRFVSRFGVCCHGHKNISRRANSSHKVLNPAPQRQGLDVTPAW